MFVGCCLALSILIPEEHAERRRAEWDEVVRKSGPYFRENGYVPLGHLIHPFNLAALRRYYRHAIRRGTIRLGDEQSSRRYVAHNESVARFFHHQIANAVSAIVGEPIKPSYVYLGSYLSGAELKKHTDRRTVRVQRYVMSGFFSRTRSGNLMAHTTGHYGRHSQGLSSAGRWPGLPGNESSSLSAHARRGIYIYVDLLPLCAGGFFGFIGIVSQPGSDHGLVAHRQKSRFLTGPSDWFGMTTSKWPTAWVRCDLAVLAQTRNQIKHGKDLVVAVGKARAVAGHHQGANVNYTSGGSRAAIPG